MLRDRLITPVRRPRLRRPPRIALLACLLLLATLQSVPVGARTIASSSPRAANPTLPPGAPADLAAGSLLARHEAQTLLRPGTGRCEGSFQSRAVPAATAPCTHGPDTYLPDRNGHVGVPPGARAQPLPQFDNLPGIPCYSSGPRVHVFYAFYEKNLLDAAGDANRRSAILNTVAVADRILSVSAAQSGGVRHIRWVMNQCRLVITPFKLGSKFSFESFDPTYLRFRLQRAGLWNRTEKGLVFLETATSPIPAGCQGIGELYHDDRDSAANLNNHGDMNTLVVTGCMDIYFDHFAAGEVAIHELFHSMGAVQPSAPHHTNNSHCWDETDVMCYDDDGRPGTFRLQQICPVTVPELLDCKDNDYFDTSPAPGSYLANHWDAAQNSFQATGAPSRWQPLPAPKIALKSPGTSVSGKVTVPLTVQSQGGGIEEVVFTVNGQKTADRQAPYAVTIDTTNKPNGTRITVGAEATDRFGLIATAKPVSMTVRNPVITLTSPSSFTSVGQHFHWSAQATPSPGHTIQKIELLAEYWDGKTALIDTDASAPFGGTTDELPRPGQFSGVIRARLTQSGGATTTSAPRDVTLILPTVTILAPTDYLYRTKNPVQILVAATAGPGLTVDSVTAKVFRGWNSPQPLTDLALPQIGPDNGPAAMFGAVWPGSTNGKYLFRVTATDSAGNKTPYPMDVQLTLGGPVGDSIDLVDPGTGASVTGSNVAIEADPHPQQASPVMLSVDGASNWTLWGDGTPPWRIPNDANDGWDTREWFNGPHVVTAGLYAGDNDPLYTGGRLVTVTNGNPEVTVGGVSAGDPVTGAVPLTASLSGVPSQWSLESVQFFANGRPVGEDATPGNGFTTSWGTGAFDDGSVQVRAVAHYTDGLGHFFDLWSVRVNVLVRH